MRTRTWITLALLLPLFVGCNLFSVTAPQGADHHISQGNAAFDEGDYQAAINHYSQALAEEPNSPGANWGMARALLRETGTNGIQLLTDLTSYDALLVPGTGFRLLPLMEPEVLSDRRADELYTAIQGANDCLARIYLGTATNGEITPLLVSVDLAGTLLVEVLLLYRDTNQDRRINDLDGNLSPGFDADDAFVLDEALWSELQPHARAGIRAHTIEMLTLSQSALNFYISNNQLEHGLSGLDLENLRHWSSAFLSGFQARYGENPVETGPSTSQPGKGQTHPGSDR